MTNHHEVISAFLDDEPFDAPELVAALSDPSGRNLMIDLVALRHIVQPEERAMTQERDRGSAWRPWLAAASVVVALVGGYYIGERRGTVDTPDAPAPSRVVQASDWQLVPNGGAR